MHGLLQRRLIFVTGKGGVGKSTVATALGLVAARRGLRTIVAELSSQDRVRRAFDHEGETFEAVELADGLFTISIDPQDAMEEYLRVKTGTVGQALGASRLFGAFAMATPGMRELLSVGKVWELSQHKRRTSDSHAYDLVIVDSPASGHGVGILRTPRTFAEIARVGPIAHQGRSIAATIADHEFTAVIAVAIGEEMSVNETLWLRDQQRPHSAEASMSKWYGPLVASAAVKDCLLLHGHYGYAEEFGLEQRLRDVMAVEIADGTAQVQKIVIARERFGRDFVPYGRRVAR